MKSRPCLSLLALFVLVAPFVPGCSSVGEQEDRRDLGAGAAEGGMQDAGQETEPSMEQETDVNVRARFAEAGEVERWAPVDDVVMGGVSSSSMRASREGTALFAGEVSLENNGGFASVRSRPRDWQMDGARGIALRVRGDGKTYKLGVRTNDAFDRVAWQASFETVTGEWQTVRVPFEAMVPRWRGRLVRDAGPLRPEDIRTLGLLISDKQVGAFQLELDWIAAWR